MRLLFYILIFYTPCWNYAQTNWEMRADSIVDIATDQLGVGYKYATSNPDNSFDCSGFVSYVYDSVGLPNSRSSKEYQQLGTNISLDECRKGDCILFTGTNAKKRVVGHVGIVVSAQEGELVFIHCSSSKKHFGVVQTEYYTSGYPSRFMGARRMTE